MAKSKEQLKKDIKHLFDKINWGKSFLDARAVEIMNTIGADIDGLTEAQDVKNLYYLDEMIKDLHTSGISLNGGFKWQTFLVDWYSELFKAVGHSDGERQNHLIEQFGEEWVEDGHFLTVEERAKFLKYEL